MPLVYPRMLFTTISNPPGISIYKNKGLSGCPKEITGNAFHGFLLSVEIGVAAGIVG